MNTKALWIALAVVIVGLGAWYVYAMNAGDAPAPTETTETPNGVDTSGDPSDARTLTVTYTDSGFSPETVTVNVGDTVEFVNESSGDMWVGADEHPTHTEYDGTSTREHCVDGAATGGSFDQCSRSGNGTSWSYTFTKAGTFNYHNHAASSAGGTVVVE